MFKASSLKLNLGPAESMLCGGVQNVMVGWGGSM